MKRRGLRKTLPATRWCQFEGIKTSLQGRQGRSRRSRVRPTGSKPSWHSPSSVGTPDDKTRRTIGRCGGGATPQQRGFFVGLGLHLFRAQPSPTLFNIAHLLLGFSLAGAGALRAALGGKKGPPLCAWAGQFS